MTPRQREISGNKRSIRPVVTGLIAGIAASVLMLFLFSLWIAFQDTPQGLIDPMATFSMCVGAFCAGFVCTRMTRGSGLLYGTLCGVLLSLLIVLAGLISGVGGIGALSMPRTFFVILPAMIGGVLGVNLHKKPGMPKR